MNKHNLLIKITFIIALFCNAVIIKAQSVAINTDGTTAATSALLDVKSTTQGILIPRMTATQRTAIATPATGLMVYQTDATAGFYFYNGTAWTSLNGTNGTNGTNGQGVPTGGTANQVLEKVNNTDYNTAWVTPTAGISSQLYVTSTNAQTKQPFGFNRYTLNFDNVVSGANTAAWTNNNTFTVPVGQSGLYSINHSLLLTAYGFTTPPSIATEIQVTTSGAVRYYYSPYNNGSTANAGDGTDGTAVGSFVAPFSYSRSGSQLVLPLQAGAVVKVFYRSNLNSTNTSQTVSFSTDGSTYLSIIKLN